VGAIRFRLHSKWAVCLLALTRRLAVIYPKENGTDTNQDLSMKPNATACFLRFHQIGQYVGASGSAENYMEGEVEFNIYPFSGKSYKCDAKVRQNHGFDYFDPDYPIEVQLPTSDTYKGPWHRESLQDAVEKYVRQFIGRKGAISISPDSVGNKFVDNTFVGDGAQAIKIDGGSSGNLVAGNVFVGRGGSEPKASQSQFDIILPDKAGGTW
jgi:hypothetical protein